MYISWTIKGLTNFLLHTQDILLLPCYKYFSFKVTIEALALLFRKSKMQMFQKLKNVFLIQDFTCVMFNSLTEALAKVHKNEVNTEPLRYFQ